MKCPICHQETTWQDNPFRPFCSERCQMLDLGNWAGGEYRIGGNPQSEIDKPIDKPASDSSERGQPASDNAELDEDSEHIN